MQTAAVEHGHLVVMADHDEVHVRHQGVGGLPVVQLAPGGDPGRFGLPVVGGALAFGFAQVGTFGVVMDGASVGIGCSCPSVRGMKQPFGGEFLPVERDGYLDVRRSSVLTRSL